MKKNKNIRYAGFWIRCVAAIIDSLIVSLATFLIFAIVMGATSSSPMFIENWEKASHEAGGGIWLSINLMPIVISWLYYALQYSSKVQATLGMRAVGLKIAGYDYHRISFARATGRHFAEILSTLTLGIGYLMIAFTKKKQGLHDFVAKTYILRK
jgi:uncharacterized RDD family membrane protein YckC